MKEALKIIAVAATLVWAVLLMGACGGGYEPPPPGTNTLEELHPVVCYESYAFLEGYRELVRFSEMDHVCRP